MSNSHEIHEPGLAPFVRRLILSSIREILGVLTTIYLAEIRRGAPAQAAAIPRGAETLHSHRRTAATPDDSEEDDE